MLIGILQTGQAPEPLKAASGDYPDMFIRLLSQRGFTFKTYHVEAMDFPASPADCDGWLITGSRHGVYEPHPFIPPLETLIRAIMASGRPLVGICFGHQIIAQAMGGHVEKFSGGWAIGPQDYVMQGQPIRLNAWHQDQVTRAPDSATPIACNDFCENAALIYGDKAFTVQAHPEFEDGFLRDLIATRGRGVVPDLLLDAAQSALGSPNSSAYLAERISEFFQQARP